MRSSGHHDAGGPTRRTVVRGAVVAATGLGGCTGLGGLQPADRTPGRWRLTAARREEIVARYASGRAARREASRHWVEGRDGWELHVFGRAAASWSRAAERFGAAAREFGTAAENCAAAGATGGRSVCAEARDYCDDMSAAAAAHAAGARAYESGEFERGEAKLDDGWTHYESALDHEVRGPDELEAALDADSGRNRRDGG